MQQRQPRLGDILDDYCPRERRVTNHAVVAMVGSDVKQTRCTTCDAEHEYKHARVPRQRRKAESPAALYSQVLAGAPKRVVHEPAGADEEMTEMEGTSAPGPEPVTGADGEPEAPAAMEAEPESPDVVDDDLERDEPDGPVHRPLIRATLPRAEGQPPAARPAPDFTIRQPAGRQNRFRPRHLRAGQFQGNRSNGNQPGGMPRGGMPRQGGNRPPTSRPARHQGHGRKRSK